MQEKHQNTKTVHSKRLEKVNIDPKNAFFRKNDKGILIKILRIPLFFLSVCYEYLLQYL